MCRVTPGGRRGCGWTTMDKGERGNRQGQVHRPYTKASLWVFSKHAGKAIESFACGADITGSVLRRHQENCLKEGRV